MNLHEYQAKELFREYGIAVSEGLSASSSEEVIDKANEAGDQERLQHWENLLRETDLLFSSPNFDQTKLPMWSLD